VLELAEWDPAVCGAMRGVCSTWIDLHDALLPRLKPVGSAVVMKGKLGWYQSVKEVDLTGCEDEDVSGVLAELGSMPSLRSLLLPASCAERAVDAEAVCGLTTLTTLRFYEMRDRFDEDGEPVEPVMEPGEWVLDLSRLTTLNSLCLDECPFAVKDKQVLELSNLTGLCGCFNVTNERLRAVSSLTALISLELTHCANMTDEVLFAVSSLTALTTLDLRVCAVTAEGLRALSSLTALTTLILNGGFGLTSEGLRAVSSLTTLTSLHLHS
jgi:hypothetical protein